MKWLNVLWIVPLIFLATGLKGAEARKPKTIPLGIDPQEHGILCDGKKPQSVHVPFGRWTILNFPFKPRDVVPGEASFDFKQIKNDLVIKALRPQAKTNLAVYLEDRRCTFDLVTVGGRGDAVLVVRDAKDDQIGVPVYE